MQRKTQLLRALTLVRQARARQADERWHHERSSRRKASAPGKFFRIISSNVSDFLNLSVGTVCFLNQLSIFFPVCAPDFSHPDVNCVPSEGVGDIRALRAAAGGRRPDRQRCLHHLKIARHQGDYRRHAGVRRPRAEWRHYHRIQSTAYDGTDGAPIEVAEPQQETPRQSLTA